MRTAKTSRGPSERAPRSENLPTIRILHLEDSRIDADLIREHIVAWKAEFHPVIEAVQTKDAYLAALSRGGFDVILTDYQLPGYSGDAALADARSFCPDVPLIMVTGSLGEERAIETLKAGAADYVLKNNLKRLVPSIRTAVRDAVLKHEKMQAEAALKESEAKYRTLFEAIDEGYCIIEVMFDEHGKPVDYRFLETNPAFEKQTGLVNAKGKTVRALVPGHEEHWFEAYGRVAMTGEAVRFENSARQLGRYYDVYAFRFGRPEDRQVGVLFKDIAERKKTEEALKHSVENMHLMVEAATRPMMVVNAEGRVESANTLVASRLGYMNGELLGMSVKDLAIPPSPVEMMMQLGDLRKHAPLPMTTALRVKTKDGTVEWMTVVANVLNAGLGHEKYLIQLEELELETRE